MKKGKIIKCSYCGKGTYKYPRDLKKNFKYRFCNFKCKHSFFKGKRLSPATEFKKGFIPWSKGKKIIRKKHGGDFKKGQIPWNKGLRGAMPVPWNKDKTGKIKINYDKVANHAQHGKFCLVCGKMFWIKHKYSTFCSRQCFSKHQSFLGREIIKCKACGEKSFVQKSNSKQFCSKKCRVQFLTRENSPSWKGGIKKDKDRRKSYDGANWRKAVFERDRWTCKYCGKRGGVLQAHHLKSYSRFPELRFDINNGITLCVKCHKKTDNYGAKSRKLKNAKS